MEKLLSAAKHTEAVRQVLGQLFPGARQALGGVGRAQREHHVERLERRVALPAVLRRYLHGSLDPGTVDSATLYDLANRLHDPEAFAAALSEIDNSALPDLLQRLPDFRERFAGAHALGIAQAILDLEPRLTPDGHSPTLTTPTIWQWHSVVGMLLLAVPADGGLRQEAVLKLLDGASTLTGRLRLLNWFGSHPERADRDAEDEILDEDRTRQGQDDLRRRVAEAWHRSSRVSRSLSP